MMMQENTANWYAIHIDRQDQEGRILDYCQALGKDLLKDAFFPRIRYYKRYQGAWHEEEKLLFPKYFFVVTDQIEQLYKLFQKAPKPIEILGTGDTPVELSNDEIHLLNKLMNHRHEIEMSTGRICDGHLEVSSGPLRGMENMVRKIDRHKRMAIIRTQMLQREMEMQVGLEVTEKS